MGKIKFGNNSNIEQKSISRNERHIIELDIPVEIPTLAVTTSKDKIGRKYAKNIRQDLKNDIQKLESRLVGNDVNLANQITKVEQRVDVLLTKVSNIPIIEQIDITPQLSDITNKINELSVSIIKKDELVNVLVEQIKNSEINQKIINKRLVIILITISLIIIGLLIK